MTPSDGTTQTWWSPLSFSTHMHWFWTSGYGVWRIFSKARKCCRSAQMEREVFLLGQFLKSRLWEHYTVIEFLSNKSVSFNFIISGSTGCVTPDTRPSTQAALSVCLGCLLTICPGNSNRQQCQGGLFSQNGHVLSHAMGAWAAKRWVESCQTHAPTPFHPSSVCFRLGKLWGRLDQVPGPLLQALWREGDLDGCRDQMPTTSSPPEQHHHPRRTRICEQWVLRAA